MRDASRTAADFHGRPADAIAVPVGCD